MFDQTPALLDFGLRTLRFWILDRGLSVHASSKTAKSKTPNQQKYIKDKLEKQVFFKKRLFIAYKKFIFIWTLLMPPIIG
jgi:hypothetical protein